MKVRVASVLALIGAWQASVSAQQLPASSSGNGPTAAPGFAPTSATPASASATTARLDASELADDDKGPAPPSLDAPVLFVLFQVLAPDGADPRGSPGISVGMRATALSTRSGSAVGLVGDCRLYGGAGFLIEVPRQDASQGDTDAIGHALAGLEGGVGPGVRLGPLDLMAAVGLGAEGIAFASSGRNDGLGEIFWYGTAAAQLRLGTRVAFQASVARKYPSWGFADPWEDRAELGIAWLDGRAGVITLFAAGSRFGDAYLVGGGLGVDLARATRK